MTDAQPLVTSAELTSGSAEAYDADELREIDLTLASLSDDARLYGNSNWTDPSKCPQSVKNTILVAARRYMKDYQAFIISRAGDEQVQFTDRGEEMGSASFTEAEIKKLAKIAGVMKSSMVAVPTTAWHMTYNPTTFYGQPRKGVHQNMADFFIELNQ